MVAGSDSEKLISFFDGDDFGIGDDSAIQLCNFLFQSFDNGAGLVCRWENTSVVFDLEFDAVLCKEVDDIMVVKLGKNAVKKASVARNTSHEVIQASVIGHIAAPAACTS